MGLGQAGGSRTGCRCSGPKALAQGCGCVTRFLGPLLRVLCSPEWGSAGQRVGARVLGAWGSAPGLAGARGLGLESVGDGGCARFSCLHNEILMTDPFP